MTLTLEAYSGTTAIIDPRGELGAAIMKDFTTYYPGGVYGTAHIQVKRRVAEWWVVQGAQRLIIRSGLEVAYEGTIDNLRHTLSSRGEWVDLTATGAWGAIAMRRRWNKPWADNRINEAVLEYYTAASASQKCTVDRNQRIRFTPKAVAWSTDQTASVMYTAPTGETIKRVTANYDLQESTQAWQLELYNAGASTVEWSVSASGTGSVDQTLAAPTQVLPFLFRSKADQTPAADGTIYGEFSSIVVYTETGSINLTEIAKDVRGELAELNSTEIYIGSNTLSIVPFITGGFDRVSDILTKAAAYGDASYNAWACYLDHSEKAPTPNGEPVLVVEQKPVLTSYDYAARLEELDGDVSFDRDYSGIYNWIIAEYKDIDTGANVYLTPDDDATLKDTASIAAYGQRDYVLKVDAMTSANAKSAALRFLSEKKEPVYKSKSPLKLRGMVRTSGGSKVPAALVRSGKRLRIENFIQDLSGTGLTLLITNTTYNGDDESVAISGGDGGVLV